MKCQYCNKDRILSASGKCSDCFDASYKGACYQSYVPYDLNIGGGDYITFELCLDCGRVQGQFPVLEEKVKEGLKIDITED